LFFATTGAVLETVGVEVDTVLLADWQRRAARVRDALRWPDFPGAIAARRHARGTSLAIAAPADQLYTATELNEWALCAALSAADSARWAHVEAALVDAAREAAENSPMPAAFATALPVIEERAALARFAMLARLELAPAFRALVAAADARGLPYLTDEKLLTIGYGAGSQTWPLDALPAPEQVPWSALHAVPTALVTGSNGKTTTVRLLAAFTRAHGWTDGYNCTDGLFVGGELLERGDYSGPAGARTVLRHRDVQGAILETARGGLLRRGLAVQRANVAVVTNISTDHFGEYGIDNLDALADTKLIVASAIQNDGLLVMNADAPLLRARAHRFTCPIGWFACDYDGPHLRAHRAQHGATSGVRAGRLLVCSSREGAMQEWDLGAITDMPLTLDGTADYNVQNIAGAALAALALGIPSSAIANVLTIFGADPTDNPGRLMRYTYRGAQVLIDYAHNPDGLHGLMTVATRLARTGRIALVLGQAGNRTNADMDALTATAAEFRPDFVVVKEIESHLRGRAPGEVPAMLREGMLRAGLPESALEVQMTELAAVQRVLDWAQPGDVLVLPVHNRAVRDAVIELLGN
jgi:UDP-N-acetylmuramyl tripeptide synthase